MNWWQQLLGQLISNTVLIGAASWVLSAVINNYVTRSNEKYKNELSIGAQVSIEKAKHELANQMMMKQVQYEKLHTRRAELIADLYGKIAETIRTSQALVAVFEPAGISSKQDRLKEFVGEFNELVLVFDRNRLYFNKRVCDKVDELIRKVKEHIIKFQVFVIEDRPDGRIDHEGMKVWLETAEALSKTIVPPLRDELDKQFKQVLGIEG